MMMNMANIEIHVDYTCIWWIRLIVSHSKKKKKITRSQHENDEFFLHFVYRCIIIVWVIFLSNCSFFFFLLGCFMNNININPKIFINVSGLKCFSFFLCWSPGKKTIVKSIFFPFHFYLLWKISYGFFSVLFCSVITKPFSV